MNLAPWLQAHAPGLYAALPTICLVLAVWAALATIIMKQVKRPTGPEWKVVLYQFFLNWPSLLPGIGLKGFLGLPISIPFLHLSSDGSTDSSSSKTSVFVPFLLASGLLSASCAHLPPPSPQTQQYDAAFGACMEGLGIKAAVTEVSNLYNILESGGRNATEIEQKLLQEAEHVAGSAAQDTSYCAVVAWQSLHPVLPNAQPTPSQAAARVFCAKYTLKHPTAKPHASLLDSYGHVLIGEASTMRGDQAPDTAILEPNTNPSEDLGPTSSTKLLIRNPYPMNVRDGITVFSRWRIMGEGFTDLARVDAEGRIHINSRTTRRQLVKAIIIEAEQRMKQSARDQAALREVVDLLHRYREIATASVAAISEARNFCGTPDLDFSHGKATEL